MEDRRPLPIVTPAPPGRRLPRWLRKPLPPGNEMMKTRRLVDGLRLNTVCAEARCPNLSECWTRRTATFMILGDRCTRRCGFCAVNTARPEPPAEDEPQRLADAATHLSLRHVVITSVARDDLPDEGAGHFARCIQAIRERLPEATVEVLVPDFHARRECIQAVADAEPEVFNHNIETVRSQTKRVRPQGNYDRSLKTLELAQTVNPRMQTKSGMMVGLGETRDELTETFRDLLDVGCRLLTIGQYLRPTPKHIDVARYLSPGEFEELGETARQMGFAAVASGPFVRSSYFAETLYRKP
ncbi:MAG TPA: lipoyl synthase [Phycisphaerae bacterium]|nr:lipoyl synthase [Phycisphaerae bacterium]